MEAELHEHAANEVRRKMQRQTLHGLMPGFSIIVQNSEQALGLICLSHCVYQQGAVWVKSDRGISLLSTCQENILESKPWWALGMRGGMPSADRLPRYLLEEL